MPMSGGGHGGGHSGGGGVSSGDKSDRDRDSDKIRGRRRGLRFTGYDTTCPPGWVWDARKGRCVRSKKKTK